MVRNTPLHWACTNPQIDRSRQGSSALKEKYTKHKDSENIVKVLLKAGADANARNMYQNTPLHAACIEGLENCAKKLLDVGADISAKTGPASKESTPLHLAAEYSHPLLVSLLLHSLADANVTNSDGENCLQIAMRTVIGVSETHKMETIEILQRHMGAEGSEEKAESTTNSRGGSSSENCASGQARNSQESGRSESELRVTESENDRSTVHDSSSPSHANGGDTSKGVTASRSTANSDSKNEEDFARSKGRKCCKIQ